MTDWDAILTQVREQRRARFQTPSGHTDAPELRAALVGYLELNDYLDDQGI